MIGAGGDMSDWQYLQNILQDEMYHFLFGWNTDKLVEFLNITMMMDNRYILIIFMNILQE